MEKLFGSHNAVEINKDMNHGEFVFPSDVDNTAEIDEDMNSTLTWSEVVAGTHEEIFFSLGWSNPCWQENIDKAVANAKRHTIASAA